MKPARSQDRRKPNSKQPRSPSARQAPPARNRPVQDFETEILPNLEAARAEWLAKARLVALELVKERGQITSDDVREKCPIPAGVDPRCIGPLFRDPMWELVGYVRSKRKICHHHPIGLWRLKNDQRAKAA
ncbi:conserved hypothetical protein [Hyphomicrobiales bacterium]|jgi:hypothetical protein|nr:conserved hypothetical protein [Hyphomicrobiales bacterium]CAH1702341.1 conserved hypothetical protein [Hyphomicrobiales bacterium]CAI0346542.1 conserved hypothetical protein [Hyphomicrobiales bacterium]